MIDPIVIVVPIDPVGKPRARKRKGQAKPYRSTKQKAASNWIEGYARQVCKDPIPAGVPLCIDIVFLIAVPKSWSSKRRNLALNGCIMPTGVPDGDNLEKQVWDDLEKIAYHNDSQIVTWSGRKEYAVAGKIIITITEYPVNEIP